MTPRAHKWLLVLILLLAACGNTGGTPAASQATVTPSPKSCEQQLKEFKPGIEVKSEVGGVWRTTEDEMREVSGPTTINVERRSGTQALHHIDLTIEYPPGNWQTVQTICSSDVPGRLYEFTLDPAKFNVPDGGEFTLTFNSYAVTGNYNKAPHGPRKVVYKKAQSTSSQAECMELNPNTVDVTIPDGSELKIGSSQKKTFRVSNCSSLPWVGYKARGIYGDKGYPATIDIPETDPGKEVTFSFTFTVPDRDKSQLIVYEMERPDGLRFGQTFWLSYKPVR